MPWTELIHVGDDEMGDFMRRRRDPEFLQRIEIYMRSVRKWDEPHIEAGFLAATLMTR